MNAAAAIRPQRRTRAQSRSRHPVTTLAVPIAYGTDETRSIAP